MVGYLVSFGIVILAVQLFNFSNILLDEQTEKLMYADDSYDIQETAGRKPMQELGKDRDDKEASTINEYSDPNLRYASEHNNEVCEDAMDLLKQIYEGGK